MIEQPALHRSLRRTILPAGALAVTLLAGLTHPASALGLGKPAIAVQASPSGFPVGSQIFGSAMLGLGLAPTGTITFTFYGPGDTACAAGPLSVSNVPVLGNGYYQSAAYTTVAAGSYHVTARYNGDLLNNPTPTTACADPAGEVTLSKRASNLRSQAGVTGATVTNVATLVNGAGPSGPTGSLTFSLFGTGDMTCANGPVFTSTKPVAGNAGYTSDAFDATAPGTYQWTVAYSGDANNNAAMTICSDPANAATVTAITPPPPPPPPVLTTEVVTALSIKPAQYLAVTWSGIVSPTSTDWVALFAVGAPDSAVVAWKYTNGQAAGTVNLKVPWGTKPGDYEVRLFANNSVQRLAVSKVLQVLAP